MNDLNLKIKIGSDSKQAEASVGRVNAALKGLEASSQKLNGMLAGTNGYCNNSAAKTKPCTASLMTPSRLAAWASSTITSWPDRWKTLARDLMPLPEKPPIQLISGKTPRGIVSMMLTLKNIKAILIQLSKKTKVGIRTPFRYGEKSPRLHAAFLCPPFITVLLRAYSVMAGLFGQPSRLAAPYRGSSNPLNPVAQSFEPFGGGYFLLDMELPL
jgi:hypothetical protein